MNKQIFILFIVGLTTLLTACGGSKSDKTPIPELNEQSKLGTQHTLTPEYTFTSTLAGTIEYKGSCSSSTTQATAGENTITLSGLKWFGEYENCKIIVQAANGKKTLPLNVSAFKVIPQPTEIESIGLSAGKTPSYSFYSDIAGTLLLQGSCSTNNKTVSIGENTITFNPINWWQEYKDCKIIVQADNNNESYALNVSPFVIYPRLKEDAPLDFKTLETISLKYIYTSTEKGKIVYSGDCKQAEQPLTEGDNIVVIDGLKWWITYDDCKLWITTAEGKATDKLSITPFRTVYPAKTPLNDTGMDFCANMPRQAEGFSAELNCADFGVTQTESNWDNGGFVIPAGQDATHGRDALAVQGKLEKIGDGHAGFDFTKLDEDGNELPYSAEQYACVRDNHTNLIWEVKQDTPVKDDLHSGKAGFLWYNSSTNGDFTGMPDAGEPIRDIKCKNTGRCDTEKFIQDVNEEGYCGLNHWRLPTYAEALSIASISSGSNIQESIIYQKNEILENVNRSYLHTSDFIVHDNQRYSVFMYNSLAFLPKTDSRPTFPGSAVLVHNGPEYAEPYSLTDKFEKLTEATALDKNTGLIWTRCPASMNDGNISGNICNKTYYWDEALAAANFANEKQFLDYSDWRLPSGTELASLFEFDHAPLDRKST